MESAKSRSAAAPSQESAAPQKAHADSKAIRSRSTSTEAQIARILALLRAGPQTTYSLRKHGLAQCAARIWDLRAMGHIIVTERVTAYDSDGYAHVGVARYTLVQEVLPADTDPTGNPPGTHPKPEAFNG